MSRLTRQRRSHHVHPFGADSIEDAAVRPRFAQSNMVRPRSPHSALSGSQGHAALVRRLGFGPTRRSVEIWRILSRLLVQR